MARIKLKSKATLRSIQSSILTKGLLYNLGIARQHLPVSDFSPLLNWLMTATKKGKLVAGKYKLSLFPKNISSLKANSLLTEVSVDRELWWCTALILANVNRVNRFLELSKQLEILVLDAKKDECFELLSIVEKEFGYSLWLMETKIGLLHTFYGLESQKKYLSTLKLAGVGNIPWIASSYSKRNEETTDFFRYVNQTIEFLDELSDSRLTASLKYNTIGLVSGDESTAKGVLYYETNSSLIDVYNAFFCVARELVMDFSGQFHSVAVECISKATNKINDNRLKRLLFLAGRSTVPCQEPVDSGVFRFKGTALSYASCHSDCSAVITWPLVWQDLASKAAATILPSVEEQSIHGQAISSLVKIYSEGSLAEAILANSLKRCLNFRWLDSSRVFHEILARELSSDPLYEVSDALSRFVYTDNLDTELTEYLPQHAQENYRKLLSLSNNVNSWIGDEDEAKFARWSDEYQRACYISEKSHLIDAERSFRGGDYDSVISVARTILSSSYIRHSRLAARLNAAALKMLNLTQQLVEFIAEAVSADSGLTDMMPIIECTDLLSKKIRRELAGNIAVPIILSLRSRYYDDSLEKILSYAYEDFLLAHGVERPSELMGLQTEFERSQLVYYLRFVCVPEIMKVSSIYDGTVDLQDERLAVCSLLLALDDKNAKSYESEIRELTRAQVIRGGVRFVEQSKMSIDVLALRKWADKKLKESFVRYRELVKVGINPSEGFGEAYFNLLADGKPLPSEFLQVPTDEAGTLLNDLVHIILHEATSNPLHGLDCYLSMRVRHGALSGQLRGPLELEGVITQKKGDGDSYSSNTFWMSRLTGLSQTSKDAIDIGLCIFSARYDYLIEVVTNEWIQIRSKDKPQGLFNMFLPVIDLQFVASSIDANTTFDEFFELCIKVFWKRVDYCLSAVHSALEQVLKPTVNEIFDTLQVCIGQSNVSSETAELDRAIRTAQTNALQASEQVKDWFRLPTPQNEPLFEVEQLIDIGLQCVQRIHKDFMPSIEKQIVDLPPVANALTIFSDIFFILFDNARKYSNAGSTPSLTIKISREGTDSISLVVENEVVPNSTLESSLERIESISDLIKTGAYQNSVRSEGGTGIIKLKKIIGPSQSLLFGYDTPELFSVKFNIPWREVSI